MILVERWNSDTTRPGQDSNLLQYSRHVDYRPVLDDLAVADAVDGDPVGLDLLVRRRDPEQLARVHADADNVADDEVAFRDLHLDLVPPRSRHAEDLRRLLHPVPVEADTRDRRVVRDEVFGDELVEDAPVARLVVVDRLDVAADQLLVLLV